MQLGWLVAYILDPTVHYHKRTLESHANFIREDEFISAGNFDTDLLNQSVVTDETTLKEVLCENYFSDRNFLSINIVI